MCARKNCISITWVFLYFVNKDDSYLKRKVAFCNIHIFITDPHRIKIRRAVIIDPAARRLAPRAFKATSSKLIRPAQKHHERAELIGELTNRCRLLKQTITQTHS